MPRARRSGSSNIHFFLTRIQSENLRFIGRYPTRGVDPQIIPTRTRNRLLDKGLVRYQRRNIRGTYVYRLVLTAKGKLARGL